MRQSVRYENGALVLIDQTRLPLEDVELRLTRLDDIIEAIKKLRVRGAPAIGIAAAYGVAIAMAEGLLPFAEIKARLAASRPTAVNLFWALDKMEAVFNAHSSSPTLHEALLQKAKAIHADDADKCRRLGEFTNSIIPKNANILTICNTGILATGGMGTAFAGIAIAHAANKNVHVFACETRPLLQGSRLTMWELGELGVSSTLITDSMAAHVMKTKKIDLIITGADRIAQNGDSANKIGTYSLAVLAKAHNIPFYIVAPTSTIDAACASGADIAIEERSADEIAAIANNRIAPQGINCYNPAFDVTPAEFISAIITETGVHTDLNNFLPAYKGA